jgi:tetratricopeptide (TPR) repeat protein/phage tail protein X
MIRFVPFLRRLLLPLLGALAFGLAGCTDNEHVNSATELDEPNYREGQALLKTGRRQEALTAFLKVIGKRGDDAPESHLEIGLLYLQHINDPLSAIYHFKKYLALRPNSPQAPLVKQRIDAATREFARTLPAQPLEGQPQRVDLVAALDRMKQENDALKQELADSKANRNVSALPPIDLPTVAAAVPEPAKAVPPTTPMFSLSVDTVPTIKTRPPVQSSNRLPVPSVRTAPLPAPARVQSSPTQNIPAQVTAPVATTTPARPANTARRYIVRPGDSLSKISMQYYGNRTRVHDIFAVNRGVMKSETDLKVGMEIKLP